jgi:DNA-binding response OmpR family regulator
MSLVLRIAGFYVHEAADAPAAIATAHMHRLALSLIDQRLGGMTGLQLAESFRDGGISVPWVLYSGFMDYELACEAGRLGAVRAIGMPFDVQAVVMEALEHVRRRRDAGWPPRPVSGRLRQPGTTVGRAAYWILKGCDANEDPSTIPTWGLVARATESQLRDAFKRLRVPRSDARDFMRVLRALWCAGGRVERVEGELTPGDPRTADALLDRAGLTVQRYSRFVTFDEFLAYQQFIEVEHPLLQALRTIYAEL